LDVASPEVAKGRSTPSCGGTPGSCAASKTTKSSRNKGKAKAGTSPQLALTAQQQKPSDVFSPSCLSIAELLPRLPEVIREARVAESLLGLLEEASEDQVNVIAAVAAVEANTLALKAQSAQLLQKLLEVAGLEAKRRICDALVPSVLHLSNDAQGCRVVQKALEYGPLQSKQFLVAGLAEGPLHVMKNMHGNHVMQMCIEQMPPNSIGFVVDAIISWGSDKAACHMYACRVVMRILEHCTEPQVRILLSQILSAAPRLAQDRYGNYVLQHVLEHGRPDAQLTILACILGEGAVDFAKHKYAHNVVEKCVILASDLEQRLPPPPGLEAEGQILVREAFLYTAAIVEDLAVDRFGSQVVLCLLENCHGPMLELLSLHLRSAAERLIGQTYAEPILAQL